MHLLWVTHQASWEDLCERRTDPLGVICVLAPLLCSGHSGHPRREELAQPVCEVPVSSLGPRAWRWPRGVQVLWDLLWTFPTGKMSYSSWQSSCPFDLKWLFFLLWKRLLQFSDHLLACQSLWHEEGCSWLALFILQLENFEKNNLRLFINWCLIDFRTDLWRSVGFWFGWTLELCCPVTVASGYL